jgi:diacylglycerol kinase (ATP)
MVVLVIGNPTAGRGHSQARIDRLARVLESRGHEVEVFLTQKAGDAALRAGRIGPDVERLVVAGGDGTINEILNGLPDPSRVPILHMPSGTANMLARDLNLPFRAHELAEILETGAVRWADMGIVNNRRFLLLVTCGFDARVTEVIKRDRGHTLGYRGYLLPTLRALNQYGPVDLHVSIDGTWKATGSQVMILNVRHYGGLLVFSDTAALDSGKFDVCVFQRGSVASLVRYGLAALFRMSSMLPDVMRFFGRRITIESSLPCPTEVDGDYFGTTPLGIDLLDAKVPLLVPARRSRQVFPAIS